MKYLSVELCTAKGCVYSGTASSLDVHTDDGSIHLNSDEESFLSMANATELTVQSNEGPHVFELKNAVAGVKGRSFTVLAESIRQLNEEELSQAEAWDV